MWYRIATGFKIFQSAARWISFPGSVADQPFQTSFCCCDFGQQMLGFLSWVQLRWKTDNFYMTLQVFQKIKPVFRWCCHQFPSPSHSTVRTEHNLSLSGCHSPEAVTCRCFAPRWLYQEPWNSRTRKAETGIILIHIDTIRSRIWDKIKWTKIRQKWSNMIKHDSLAFSSAELSRRRWRERSNKIG